MKRTLRDELRAIFREEISITEIFDRRASYLPMAALLGREVIRSVRQDRAFTLAHALAYKSLAALVPVLAISLGVVAMLEPASSEVAAQEAVSYSELLLDAIREQIPDFSGKEDFIASIRRIADQARLIAGLGFVVLFVTAYSLLSSIEDAFNMIWQVRERRPLLGRLGAFLSTMLVVPILMSLSVYLTARLAAAAAEAAAPIGWLRILEHVLPGLTSFLLTTLAMTALLYLVPYTPVRLRNALWGGALSAVLLELAKYGFQAYAMHAGEHWERIYGPLLAVPFFLLWLWVVWVVILMGSEIAFVSQNFRDLAARAEMEKRGVQSRLYLAVRVAEAAAYRFRDGTDPEQLVEAVAEEVKLPPYMVRDVVGTLADAAILYRVVGREDGYVPGKDITRLTVGEVVRAVERDEYEVPNAPQDALRDRIAELFARVNRSLRAELDQWTLADLVQSCEPDAPQRSLPAPGAEPADESATQEDAEETPWT
jgi:membrane protein